MGIPGQTDHPEIVEAYQKIIDSCSKNDVTPGIHIKNHEEATKRIEQGMRLITFSYDIKLLQRASRRAIEKLHGLVG